GGPAGLWAGGVEDEPVALGVFGSGYLGLHGTHKPRDHRAATVDDSQSSKVVGVRAPGPRIRWINAPLRACAAARLPRGLPGPASGLGRAAPRCARRQV